MLVTIIKKYKRHYLYQSVVFCRNICSYPFHSFQRLNFSCTVGCGGWKIPQMDNLWTGSPGTRGYRSRCCWRFSSHVVLLRKKITNGERYKWFISTIFSLYSISLHFRLEFFFFFFLFQISVLFKAPGTIILNTDIVDESSVKQNLL